MRRRRFLLAKKLSIGATDTVSDGRRIGDDIAELDVLKRETLAALAQPITHAPSGGASRMVPPTFPVRITTCWDERGGCGHSGEGRCERLHELGNAVSARHPRVDTLHLELLSIKSSISVRQTGSRDPQHIWRMPHARHFAATQRGPGS